MTMGRLTIPQHQESSLKSSAAWLRRWNLVYVSMGQWGEGRGERGEGRGERGEGKRGRGEEGKRGRGGEMKKQELK